MTDQVNNNYLVSTLKDEDDNDFSEGDLSLREAIALSESGSTITFDPELANGTINLSLGELIIDDSVTIQGLCASHTVINAGGRSRIFNVDDGSEAIQSEVAIADLTITGGYVDSFSETPPENTNDGGGILNAENLTIDRANIHDNSAFFSGGGIASTGKLNVNDSAVYNNSTSSGRFGNNGGGITNDGTAIINQSTISNNETGSRSTGGGIQNNGTLNISNSTVSGNQSGIFNGGESTVTSSIIAKNIDNNDVEGKDFITGGNNLIGGESLDFRVWSAGGFTNDENGDIVGTGNAPIGPKLGEVQDNDGATFTQALHSDSPGVNTGSNPNELETDQRGEGFDRTVGDSIDIGAYELQDNNGGGNPTELVVSTLEDENDGDFGEGDLSLREAIAISESGGTITFDSELANGAIDLSLGQLVIDKSITINGLGASNTVIDAGDRSGVFDINDDTDAVLDVELNNLTITGGGGIPAGDTPLQNRGGGIFNLEDLEINNANIYNNRAFSQGGGIYSDGTLTVNNSAIYENITDSGGRGASGGGITNAGTAIINQSTVSNNTTGGSGAGGIENAEGTLVVTNSTVNGNDVGGISNQSGEVTVTSSIVAGNANNNDVFGDDFISGGNNLIGGENPDIGSANGFTNAENGDIVGTSNAPIDPKLGEIQDNGGATFTQALHSDSPGVNTGSNPNELETDQRGEGFDRTIGDGTDIGAYELQDNNGGGNPTELVVSTLEDENDGDFSEGDLSLREAIILANENQGDDTIKFDNSLTGGTITFNESQERNLTINESVLIEGLGQDNLTLDGGFIFNITPEVGNVIIDGLNLTGGKIDGFGQFRLSNSKISQTIETGSDNSAIISRDRSVIFNSTISDNSGGSNVGILVESGTTAIEGSEIANNQADQGQSGIIVGSEGTVNIINSTIANNRGRSIAGIDNNGRLNITSSSVVGNNGG
ncbi:MAG: choice-of-anchor Q domain-containing protein [Pleurocapsa sp.]